MVEKFLATSDAQEPCLADRERQVLQFVAEGKTSKEIADALDISVKTGMACALRPGNTLEIKTR